MIELFQDVFSAIGFGVCLFLGLLFGLRKKPQTFTQTLPPKEIVSAPQKPAKIIYRKKRTSEPLYKWQ